MKEFCINIPGFTIGAKAFGDKNNRPVLCLHGKLDNAASFDMLAPLLNDFYVVARAAELA